jgi:SEC-C motif
MSAIPTLEQEITAGLGELRELLSKCSTSSVAGMCFAQTLVRDESPDRLMSPAKQIAFMLGVLLQDPEPSDAEDFDRAEWDRAKRILDRLFNAYMLLYMPSPEDSAPTPEWRESREVAMAAFLHYFNTGLLATIEQIAGRVARYLIPYDLELVRILGISATECIGMCNWINNHLQQTLDNVADLVDAARRQHEMFQKAAATQNSPTAYPDNFAASTRPEFAKLFSTMQKVGIVSLKELQLAFPDKGLIFWQTFSIARGEGPALRYPTELSEFELRPLIRVDECHAICPSINAVYGAVLLLGERALLNQSGLRETYLRARDRSLEREARDILRRFFGTDAQVWSSIYESPDSQFEHDIVIADTQLCLVVEAKATPPIEPFRDPDKAFVRLKRAFRAETGLQKAFEQANRLVSRLKSGERVCLYDADGNQVGVLEPESERVAIAICVTRDNFGLLATNLSLLLEKERGDPYPWAVNVLDLWNLAEAWEYLKCGSKQLRDYLEQRIRLHGTVISDDELDYAGSFIKHGSFGDFPKGKRTLIQLNPDYSSVFDEIYRHKYLEGPPVVLERTARPVFTDFRESLRQGHPVIVKTQGDRVPQRKVGRNEPCPCNSGKKFKKCCGRSF